MLRKLILLGTFAGMCASIPALYQSNPALFENLMRAAIEQPQPSEQPRSILSLARAPTDIGRTAPVTGRKVQLASNAGGHFVADFKLNGRIVGGAMADTGATLVAINRSTARRIGIMLSESDFKHTVDTANGRTRAASAVIDVIEIGRIRVERVQAVILDDDALRGTLIGMSFLGRMRKYSFESGALLLEQ